jgi:HSP20 family protein
MLTKKETGLARTTRDPFALFRQMQAEFDRMFEGFGGPSFRLPSLRDRAVSEGATWTPGIDVFERGGRLVTKIDLPGVKKEDVKVEVADGNLTISGERQSEAEEKKENYYRCEREYGSFYRSVPLPEGVKIEDVKATFTDGVLEVSIPMPPQVEAAKPRRIEIQEPEKSGKTAA